MRNVKKKKPLLIIVPLLIILVVNLLFALLQITALDVFHVLVDMVIVIELLWMVVKPIWIQIHFIVELVMHIALPESVIPENALV